MDEICICIQRWWNFRPHPLTGQTQEETRDSSKLLLYSYIHTYILHNRYQVIHNQCCDPPLHCGLAMFALPYLSFVYLLLFVNAVLGKNINPLYVLYIWQNWQKKSSLDIKQTNKQAETWKLLQIPASFLCPCWWKSLPSERNAFHTPCPFPFNKMPFLPIMFLPLVFYSVQIMQCEQI